MIEVRGLRLRRWLLRGVVLLGLLLAGYGLLAYLCLPWGWRYYERRRIHAALQGVPRITHTGEGLAGDPLNIALVGTREQLIAAMRAAGWSLADPVSLRSSVSIAWDVLHGHPYPAAPVSSLYLWGRREDLAFEQPVGQSPRQRHHVRFWRAPVPDEEGTPLWVGAATFDRSVGLSRYTGQITHHIAPDIDAERDKIVGDLRRAGRLGDVSWRSGVGPTRDGRNGGGDSYFTDGRMIVGVLREGPEASAADRR